MKIPLVAMTAPPVVPGQRRISLPPPPGHPPAVDSRLSVALNDEAGPSVDPARVAALRQSIADGRLVISPDRIAQTMLAARLVVKRD